MHDLQGPSSKHFLLLACGIDGATRSIGAHTVQQLKGNCGVNIFPPVFSVCRNRDFPIGPLAGEVDAHTGHHRRTVLQAECGQVQTMWQHTSQTIRKQKEHGERKRENRQTFSIYSFEGLTVKVDAM